MIDITSLRRRSRSPEFCKSVDSHLLSTIVNTLFTERLEFGEKVDVIAIISNVALINRSLHLEHLIPQYSCQLFEYCDEFMKCIDVDELLDFVLLVPVYRLLFLMLYGALDNVPESTIGDVFNLLFDGFNQCVGILNKCLDLPGFQMVVIELFKCLYSLHHNYHYGGDLIQNNLFLDKCVVVVNYCMENMPSGTNKELLVRNGLNFVLMLITDVKTGIDFNAVLDFPQFCRNMGLILQLNLRKLENGTGSYADVTSLLTIINQVIQNVHDHAPEVVNNLSEILIPSPVVSQDHFSITNYNSIMFLIASSYFLSLSFLHLQELTFIKLMFIESIYHLTNSHTYFLELIGYLNMKNFIEKNDISLDVDNLEFFMEPTSKFLDKEKYLDLKSSIPQSPSSTTTTIPELTPEEKEREAEKLFVLFERMEKLGTFENFQNPVKQWQQEGKFEDLDS